MPRARNGRKIGLSASEPSIAGFGAVGGGRTRARTWDPLIKSQLLYQLSYAPGSASGRAYARAGRLAKRPPDVQQRTETFPRADRVPAKRKSRRIPAAFSALF
jgi:hypothetical protein